MFIGNKTNLEDQYAPMKSSNWEWELRYSNKIEYIIFTL